MNVKRRPIRADRPHRFSLCLAIFLTALGAAALVALWSTRATRLAALIKLSEHGIVARQAVRGAARCARDSSAVGPVSEEECPPRMFVGVFSTPDTPGTHARAAYGDQAHSQVHSQSSYRARRQVLRSTWFPTGHASAAGSITVRFVVGVTHIKEAEEQLQREQALYGDLLRLPGHVESYASLTSKSRDFFLAVAHMYGCDLSGASGSSGSSSRPGDEGWCSQLPQWVIKVDDDVYVNLRRLLAASTQWTRMAAGYVGCMKHGWVWKEPGSRWYEPEHNLLGPKYYLHAYGSVYALSGDVVRDVIVRQAPRLRLLANEDTTMGLWMVAHDVVHFEDMRLCVPACHPAGIVLQHTECAGLCEPLSDMVSAHNDSLCRDPIGNQGVGWWEQMQEAPSMLLRLPNGTLAPAPLRMSWRERIIPRSKVVTRQKLLGAKSKQQVPVGEFRWWEMTQVLPNELPFLPDQPEHTFFENMWV